MKVIIMNCNNKDAWYSNRIGKIYTTVGESKDKSSYLVKTKKSESILPVSGILKEDCEVIQK